MLKRLLIGLGLLGLIAAGVAAWAYLPLPRPVTQIAVRGYCGSEKMGLLEDPAVRRILKNRYGITVDAVAMDSWAQVQADAAGQDFLWLADEAAAQLCADHFPGQARAEALLSSPLVLYTWAPVTAALEQQGIVRKGEDGTYTVDLPRLLRLIDEGREWREIGLPQLYGKIDIVTADPGRSSSAVLFYALAANLLGGGRVADERLAEAALPVLRTYRSSQGHLERSTRELFKRFVRTGMGDRPIIAGYENQLIEFALQEPGQRSRILAEIDVLYPHPTVWSSHTLVALTPAGQALLHALQDKELQAIAWQRHGFRSGLAGVQNAALLGSAGYPAQSTSAMPLPEPAVMEELSKGLR